MRLVYQFDIYSTKRWYSPFITSNPENIKFGITGPLNIEVNREEIYFQKKKRKSKLE